MSEFLAELLVTMVFVTFVVGVVGGVLRKWSKAAEAGWIVITVGWGLAVTMGIFVSGTVSDAHLNPAVTLGFASIGDFPWSKVPAYISGLMIGALIGATIVVLNYLPHWRESKDMDERLGVFSRVIGSSYHDRTPFH